MSQGTVVDTGEGIAKNPVRCDKCHSPYAIDPANRKKTSGESLQKPRFRKRLDVETNQVLILCNKCGLKMSREKKRPPKKPLPTDEEKKSYLEEAKAFAESLAERLQEPDAKNLYCPNIKSNACGCLQKYIQGGEDLPKRYERALCLASLLKNAKELSTEKMHTASSSGMTENTSEKSDAILCRGIGNRHSKMFEDFVLSNRKYLRDQLKLCERACQKVLMYSNNFLHKELKSMKNQRVEHKSNKVAKMKPINELSSLNCCKDQCVRQAVIQPDMLESWRLNALEGQREARRVIAEMLASSVGLKSPCYRFISLVTGCSLTTICSVNNHLKSVSGSADPPEHGLKKWWRENPKKGRRKEEPENKKTPKFENKCFNVDTLGVEATAVASAGVVPRSCISPPPYESVVSSKESLIQMESFKQPPFDLSRKVDVPQLPIQEYQEVVESNVQQNSQSDLPSTSSLLQSTVQQLLLSPDIVSVTILAAPKSPSGHAQMMTMENMTKEGVGLPQTVDSGQGTSASNVCQVIQICRQSPPVNPEAMQNMVKDKFASSSSGHYTSPLSTGERMASIHPSPEKPAMESVQRRQLLHVFEIPHHESTSHTSAISYFAEKAQSQKLSIISPSNMESASGSTISEEGSNSCLRSLIILPETVVLDPSVPGSKITLSPNEINRH